MRGERSPQKSHSSPVWLDGMSYAELTFEKAKNDTRCIQEEGQFPT